ncbi:MAG: hypothetical protein QOG43_2997 [Actinomycetota bacterium]|nr:hypothetical protein [Actinomycetota bacterium]
MVNIRSLVAVAVLALTVGACSDPPPSNYRPPDLGVPATGADITGIYRTIHQGLLQLRGNGELNLIIPEGIGATSGTFAVKDGHVTVHTDGCGDQVGAYNVEVLPGPVISRSTLMFEAVDDPCAARLKYLTIDPWVYADS